VAVLKKEEKSYNCKTEYEDTKHKQQVFLVPVPMQPNRETRKTTAPTPMNK
jgi:hypothetical protein